MSTRWFEVEIPVLIRESQPFRDKGALEQYSMTVTVIMGPGATTKDAVEELGRRIQSVCNTDDIGDCI